MNDKDFENNWFEELYFSYSRELFWIAMAYSNNKSLAEDAVQEAFLYVWKNRNTIKNNNQLQSYLYRVVKSYITDFFRHQQVREKHHPIIQEEMLERERLTSEDDFDKKIEVAQKLINSLPEGCRKVFVMAVIEGASYKQVANQLNISQNTVKTQVKIAYKKLYSSNPEQFLLVVIMLKLQILTPFFACHTPV